MVVLRLALAALVLAWVSPVAAQDVRLSTPDGTIAVEGRLLDFDGEFYDLETIYGPLTLDASRVTCEGAACPDLATFAPVVRISGSATVGSVLVPALIEAFAGRAGMGLERMVESDRRFSYQLADPKTGRPAVRFDFHLSTSGEGFADLVAGQADLVLASREVREAERNLVVEAGLGDLFGPGRAHVVALDGLVPVTGPGVTVPEVSMRDLARVFAGEITNWSALGGPDAEIELHLGLEGSGLSEGVLDRVMARYDLGFAAGIKRHSDDSSVSDMVAQNPGALGIVPFSEVGNAAPIALTGPCGFPAEASPLTLKTEDYPLTAPLFIYVPEKRMPRLVREFLSYAQSPVASLIVRRAGFVDQRPETIPLAAQGVRLANAIQRAGRTIRLGDLRSMVEVLSQAERLTVTFRFEEGSSELDAQSRSNVELLAEAIESGLYDGATLLFAGFSDGRGDADTNRRLSERRAEAVRAAVIEAAPAADTGRVSFEVAGFGEALPMACDEVAWGQHVNRRVEVWVR